MERMFLALSIYGLFIVSVSPLCLDLLNAFTLVKVVLQIAFWGIPAIIVIEMEGGCFCHA